MKRREFIQLLGAGIGASPRRVCLSARPPPASSSRPRRIPVSLRSPGPATSSRSRSSRASAVPHKAGQKLKYPDEKGKNLSVADGQHEWRGSRPRVWRDAAVMYTGTPYEKVIDPEGLTTEFIRCPDPSRVIVAKISRRRVLGIARKLKVTRRTASDRRGWVAKLRALMTTCRA